MTTTAIASEPTKLRFLTEEQLASFQRDGYLIVRGFLSDEEATEVRETFMAENANGPIEGLSEIRSSYSPDDPLSFYPRMMHPHRHSERAIGPLSMRRMLDERIGLALEDMMGEPPLAAQSMFYFKPAGARGQDFHQDNFYLRVSPGTCVAAWLSVDDSDPENGGMSLAPGSHLLDIACPEKADPELYFTTDHVEIPEGLSAEPAIMKAGDMLFFNGSVIHGSTPNASADRFRRAFICHYVPESTYEMASGYFPLLRFNGEEVSLNPATGGGPCGVPVSDVPH